MMKALTMKLETGRLEKRFAVAIPVRITSLDRLWQTEEAMTENMSFLGARILVKNMWRKGEQMVVESPKASQPFQAEVIYCQPLKSGGAAIGVRLTGERRGWISGDGQVR